MSTSAAMTGIAVSQVAIASAAAHEARVDRCKITVAQYDSRTATIEQAKDYASCINTLHPSALSGPDLVIFKAIFVVALLCGIGGAVSEWRSRWSDIQGVALMFVCWFFLGPVSIVGVLGVLYGIYWVLT